MESKEGSNDINFNGIPSIRQKLTNLEREYNTIRQEFFRKSQQYYKQSIASKVVTEDELRRLINKSEELKRLYFSVQSDLMAKRPIDTWSFRNSFKFNSQINKEGNNYGNN